MYIYIRKFNYDEDGNVDKCKRFTWRLVEADIIGTSGLREKERGMDRKLVKKVGVICP